jgi:hypothetical protein
VDRRSDRGYGWRAAGFVLGCAMLSASAATPAAAASAAPPDRPTFIPIPEIDTAPDSGVTLGLIPVVLSNNDRGEIDRILAPDVIHSQYFGWGASWRTFRYPSADRRWSFYASAKQRVESGVDAEYDAGLLRTSDWSWSAHAVYDRSGTGRFYGLGNDSRLAGEATFIDRQFGAELTAARNFTHELQLAWTAHAVDAEVGGRALDFLPAIDTVYPAQPGVGRVRELQQRVVLTWDTRDSDVVPRRGERWAAFAGFAPAGIGSGNGYSFVGVDLTGLRPLGPAATLVGHAAVRYMPSYAKAPFWDLSSLGGDRSVTGGAQPLRAYGEGRFVDRNSFEASVEARFDVRSLHLFGTELTLELAPFVDSGKVFTAMSADPLTHLHTAGGIGFRLVASPFVVGYVDVGFGREKAAVFSGIDYPF